MVKTANEEREDQIASCFGQGINPKENITAGNEYGDDEADHNANENAVFEEMNDLDDNSKEYGLYKNVNLDE
jgi:hypothetical protein